MSYFLDRAFQNKNAESEGNISEMPKTLLLCKLKYFKEIEM